MKNKLIYPLLLGAVLISVFLNLFRFNQVPPCLNADEVAFGYNAYSIAQTGKDEFGNFLPLRFESFKDFKLPVFVYFSVPFVKLLGLNELSTRLPNVVVSIFFIPLVYLILKKLFNNFNISVVGTYLIALTPWTYILSRHAHEGVIGALLMLLALYFLLDLSKGFFIKAMLLTNLFIILAANSYHSYRMFVFFWIFWQIVLLGFYKTKVKFNRIFFWIILFFTILIPLSIDAGSSLNRVGNLLFTQNPGIHLRLQEYLIEHGSTLIHNIYTQGIVDISNRYISQISPEFFLIWGDKNWRFGYQYLGLITLVEYVFIFIGVYYLFREHQFHRFLLLSLLLISPIPNALTWQDASLIRVYFMIFPLLFITSYGLINFLCDIKNYRIRLLTVFGLISMYGFFLLYHWDVYLFHYPKRIEVIRAWQCGYKELGQYVKNNYNKFDKFVITDRHGQPYIYLLYYLQYDPAKYQKQAIMTIPDSYGFGQVKSFDKFNFQFSYDNKSKKTAYIGYPEEFTDLKLDQSKIKKIQIRSEEIFWIYENP